MHVVVVFPSPIDIWVINASLRAALYRRTLLIKASLNVCENAHSPIRGDQARYHFLSHILRGRPEQILQLHGGKLLDDSGLLGDTELVALFKLVQAALLLI